MNQINYRHVGDDPKSLQSLKLNALVQAQIYRQVMEQKRKREEQLATENIYDSRGVEDKATANMGQIKKLITKMQKPPLAGVATPAMHSHKNSTESCLTVKKTFKPKAVANYFVNRNDETNDMYDERYLILQDNSEQSLNSGNN